MPRKANVISKAKNRTVALFRSQRNGLIGKILERIIEVAHPQKVYLFGSRAKGKAPAESDYDFLVVVSLGISCRDVTAAIHRRMLGIHATVDVHVITPDILERFADNPALIYSDIIRTGKLLYAA